MLKIYKNYSFRYKVQGVFDTYLEFADVIKWCVKTIVWFGNKDTLYIYVILYIILVIYGYRIKKF